MNPVQTLRDQILRTHTGATAELIPPLHSDGVWSLEIEFSGKQLAIEWSNSRGFGVSTASNENFGESADEFYESLDAVARRVDQLLTTTEETSPPMPVLLSRLRERRGLTQQELADRLRLRQATISGIERRDDIQLSTLHRIVEALGGTLEIISVFPNARYRICIGPSKYRVDEHSSAIVRSAPDAKKARLDGTAFTSLRKIGALTRATEIATQICSRHTVLEIP